jgi:hypothetical protein
MAGTAMILTSCVQSFLPDKLDAFDRNVSFTQTIYRPALGRTTLFTNNFNFANSTLPLTFEITSITCADGSPAPELTDVFPVKVWSKPYLGIETSLEEIEAKRSVEYRKLFDIRKHSGELIMWENANSSFVQCSPEDGYIFDVVSSNSGGYKTVTRMQLVPQREVEYEPNPVNPETGLVENDYVNPTSVTSLISDNFRMIRLTDIHVYFRRNIDMEEAGNSNSLTFKFYNPDWTPIDPHLFKDTDWNSLLHGFNMELTSEYVRYQVAYPIPLLDKMPTKYTNTAGTMAHVVFATSWLYNNSFRIRSSLSLDFAIYSAGSWEIIFLFSSNKPRLQ